MALLSWSQEPGLQVVSRGLGLAGEGQWGLLQLASPRQYNKIEPEEPGMEKGSAQKREGHVEPRRVLGDLHPESPTPPAPGKCPRVEQARPHGRTDASSRCSARTSGRRRGGSSLGCVCVGLPLSGRGSLKLTDRPGGPQARPALPSPGPQGLLEGSFEGGRASLPRKAQPSGKWGSSLPPELLPCTRGSGRRTGRLEESGRGL